MGVRCTWFGRVLQFFLLRVNLTQVAARLCASHGQSRLCSRLFLPWLFFIACVQGFGRAAAAAMLSSHSEVLGCNPAVWRRNLCCMAACGIADPTAALQRAPLLLPRDHAAPDFLQRRLLLQRSFRLTAAQLYEQHAPRMTCLGAHELAQRLQFVEYRGQAHRLVAKASRGRKPAAAMGEQRRPALCLRYVTATLEHFLPAVGASQAEWEAWAAANPPAACPLCRWAQQAAEEESARLAAALPPELAQWEKQQHFRSSRKAQLVT